MKKIILLALTTLMMGCNMAMDKLDVVNGTEYVVKAKKVRRDNYEYAYRLVKVGDTWYDYLYKDTADYNVGDTLIIIIRRVDN